MNKPDQYDPPLTFDLTAPQVRKIDQLRRSRRLRTASAVVRLAIAEFDLRAFKGRPGRHRQISVRLPRELREKLRGDARARHVSIGELLRVAIEALPLRGRKSYGKRTRAGRNLGDPSW